MKALFISFPASDYAASTAFYQHIIGLPVIREYEGAPHKFTNYDLDGFMLKVYEWQEPYYGRGHSGLFIKTIAFDEIIDRLQKTGAVTFPGQVHEWGGRCCSVTDPFGNIFDLIDANQMGNV